MKKILIALLIITGLKSYSQNLQLIAGNNVLIYNSATITAIPSCEGPNCWTDLKNGQTQLARILNDQTIIWNANLIASSVSDTLGASGNEAVSRITVPTATGTNTIIQNNAIAIIVPNATYTITYGNNFYPIIVKRNSDNQVMVTINKGGIMVWNVSIQNSWLGKLGTTRIKRITLP